MKRDEDQEQTLIFGELCSKVPKLGANTSASNIGNWSPITGLMREQTHVSE